MKISELLIENRTLSAEVVDFTIGLIKRRFEKQGFNCVIESKKEDARLMEIHVPLKHSRTLVVVINAFLPDNKWSIWKYVDDPSPKSFEISFRDQKFPAGKEKEMIELIQQVIDHTIKEDNEGE